MGGNFQDYSVNTFRSDYTYGCDVSYYYGYAEFVRTERVNK